MVSGPYLIYEFILNGLSDPYSVEPKKTSDGKPAIGSSDQLLTSGDLTGSLIPYVYCVKERVKYTYYWTDKAPIVIPKDLNSNMDDERLKAVSDVNGEVKPDLGRSAYGTSPYYVSSIMEKVVYKIPLETIIGRYMSKQSLLQVWNSMKENIDSSEDQIVDDILVAIKGIYEDECLREDNPSVKDVKAYTKEDNTEEVKKTTEAKDDNHTFADFAKVGLETTYYNFDGLMPVEGDQAKAMPYIDDFISATIVPKTITVTVRVTDYSNVVGYEYNEETGKIDKPRYGKKDDTKTISVDDLGGIESFYGKLGGDGGKGVTVKGLPSSADGAGTYYGLRGSEDRSSEIMNKIILYCESQGWESPKIEDGTIQFKTLFLVASQTPSQYMWVEHARTPALMVTAVRTWAREIKYNHSIIMNMFDPNNVQYVVPKSKTSTGIMSFKTTEEVNNYRGAAYEEIVGKMQEKDVVSMLTELEYVANEGDTDAYDYMRDMYRLVKATQDYSQEKGSGAVNPDTYTYIYMPDSILYYDDSQTQMIYWLEMAVQRGVDDYLTEDEINHMRSKDIDLTWQVVDYENLEECNGKVYALYPFGSQYVRSYYQTELARHGNNPKSIDHGVTSEHMAADMGGRSRINEILTDGGDVATTSDIGAIIYDYELKRLTDVYADKSTAKTKLVKELKEQRLNNPIVAIAPGRVERMGFDGNSGIYVVIRHTKADGSEGVIESKYMHMKRWPVVNIGDYIGAGTLLGYEGTTGRSTGYHLHFSIHKGGAEDPRDYIYPVFNPFYNKEKAEGVGYSTGSEYMTLYRTVTMVGTSSGQASSAESLSNNVPRKALVNNLDNLIQRQGTIERASKPFYKGNTLAWNSAGEKDTAKYLKYLEDEKLYDFYLEDAFFDKELAQKAGYLEIPEDLYEQIYGYVVVKTDLPGALPELTREEFEHILKYWLAYRYPKNKVDWLMEKVFTEKNIDLMIESQNKYKVSLVFALAVGVVEQQLGLSYYSNSNHFLGAPGNYNIFSIKGEGPNGYIEYQGGKHWRRYFSYGNAFELFDNLIANSQYYFKAGNYTVAQIAPIYCGEHWGVQVTQIIYQIMQFYTGHDSPIPIVPPSDIVELAERLMNLLMDSNYGYGDGTVKYDPFSNALETNPGICDCTGFCSSVIAAYGRLTGNKVLASFPHLATPGFVDLAQDLDSNSSRFSKDIELVWIRPGKSVASPNGSPDKSLIEPGDILLYYVNTTGNQWDRDGETAHHAEFFVEWDKNKNARVISCGFAPADHSSAITTAGHAWNELYAVFRVKGFADTLS